MKRCVLIAALGCLMLAPVWASVHAAGIHDAVQADYDTYLKPLFIHFHQNPELSLQEHGTAARMAKELRAEGFEVTEGETNMQGCWHGRIYFRVCQILFSEYQKCYIC